VSINLHTISHLWTAIRKIDVAIMWEATTRIAVPVTSLSRNSCS
jgi:hypothetical protein